MGRREDDQSDRGAAVGLGLAELLPHLPARHLAVLGLDDDAEVRATGEHRVDGQDEVALLRSHRRARLIDRPVEQVAGAAGELTEECLDEILEVAALRGGL